MSVELRPLGVACNIKCLYCYQNQQRDAGNVAKSYDMEAMKAAIEKEGGPFTLFGGEPLLVPLNDLEELLRWGLEKYGSNSMQTNGILINDEHVRLFRQYKVSVGFSMDGPESLNDIRWANNLKKTRESTQKAMENLQRLCREGLTPGLIVTLHKNNATSDKLPAMHQWVRELYAMGIRSVRLHILESENELIRQTYALTIEENLEALLSFSKLNQTLPGIEFDLFKDMKDLLAGNDKKASCVWRACDPYTTSAVRGVEGYGQSSNCGRTNKDGVDFIKAEEPGYERYIGLFHTKQEAGGCRDCRFFLLCKGQCPGTAIDGDWRNKTEHCELWFKLFEQLESDAISKGQKPFSRWPERATLEKMMLKEWAIGNNPSIERLHEQLNDKPIEQPI